MVFAHYVDPILRMEAWVATQRPTVSGCWDEDVASRIAQRVVRITEMEFCRQVAARLRQGLAPVAADAVTVRAGGLTMDLRTGCVGVPLRQWVRHLGLFLGAWGELLVQMLPGLVRRGSQRSSAVTLFWPGGARDSESDREFADFCLHGPIAPLKQATRVIVQIARDAAPPRRPSQPRVGYSKHPIAAVVRECTPWRERWRLLMCHLAAPVALLAALYRSPLNILVARDLALLPVVRRLDRHRRIEAMVVTTSAFPEQPLWWKGARDRAFRLHTVWYSQNCIPKVYDGDTSLQSLPGIRHMRVDTHWVWTPGFKGYLENASRAVETHVVGPILFYLPSPLRKVDSVRINVAAFDVTPLPDDYVTYGAGRNYYSVECMTRFVDDVLSAVEAIAHETGRDMVLLLKHKRRPRIGVHADAYLSWLTRAAATRPLRLMSPETSLYTLTADCACSVAVPYTTAPYVSAFCGKPALYYDPMADLIPVLEEHPLVHFAAGRDQLFTLLRECLGGAMGVGRSLDVSTPQQGAGLWRYGHTSARPAPGFTTPL